MVKENEAVLVRRIFKEYLNGKGTYAIAKELTDEQCPTIRDGERWNDSVIKEILLNPVYVGNLLLQKTYSTRVVSFKLKQTKDRSHNIILKITTILLFLQNKRKWSEKSWSIAGSNTVWMREDNAAVHCDVRKSTSADLMRRYKGAAITGIYPYVE